MRVSVQGCLILLLCFFPVASYATVFASGWTSGYVAGDIDPPEPPDTWWEANGGQLIFNRTCGGYPTKTCPAPEGSQHRREVRACPTGMVVVGQNSNGHEICDVQQCEQLTHEPGGTIDESLCNTCSDGYVPVDGSGYTAPFQCMRNREPQECADQGLAEARTSEGAFCLEECEHGMFNGVCLAQPEPDEPECSQDHPEYKGTVGYGGDAVLICGDPQSKCDALGDGYTWGVVQKGNTTVESCFPNEYNPPQCSGTDVLKIDDFGASCLPVKKPDGEESPGSEDDPNDGDSDGDGQGDLTGVAKQIQDVKKLLDRGNTNTDNINETLKGLGKKIQDGNKAITDAIGDIPGGGGGNNGGGEGLKDGEGNDYLKDIKQNTRDTADALEAPEGGLNTEGLGNAPEFGESATRLKSALFGHPTIQAVTTIPTIGTSTTCPTWTIPANDYWDALTLDVHCAILEDYRSTLSVLFVFFWTVVAIFLFLRA